MIQDDGIAEYIAFQYALSIDKISEHYNEQTGITLIFIENRSKQIKRNCL